MTSEIDPEHRAHFLMAAAVRIADESGVTDPRVWYCTHILGERVAYVVEEPIARTSPTWPGDLVTRDDAEAFRWLIRPPEQESLGVSPGTGPVVPEAPNPSMVGEGVTAIVDIHTWVRLVREKKDAGCRELRRTRNHSHVEIACMTVEAVNAFAAPGVPLCGDCGRPVFAGEIHMVVQRVPYVTCPDGLGCTVPNGGER